MATYTASQLGIKAPSGGFQDLGWYEGYQYKGGTFGEKGAIHPDSPQVGAGQKVSSEVNRQSDVAQGLPVGTIDKFVSQPTVVIPSKGFQDKGQVSAYLGSVASKSYGESNVGVPAVRSVADIAADVKSQLPTTAPVAPKTAEIYAAEREKLGLDGLESTVNTITAQLKEIEAAKRIRTQSEIGKPVPLNVISGRVSEVERQENERIDALNREKSYAVDQLNSAYRSIDLVMKFTQTDFENAKSVYDTQFKQAMDIMTMAHNIQQDEISLVLKQQDIARANAQIMMNAIKDGGLDYASASPEMKAQINKLELQSGLPVGFFGSIQKDPKADIISTTSNDGQIQVLLRNPDGTMRLQTYGTKSAGSGTAEQRKQSAIADMEKTLAEAGGSDGIVSPSEWSQARQAWIAAGLQVSDFDAAFASQHTNPAWGDYVFSDEKYKFR